MRGKSVLLFCGDPIDRGWMMLDTRADTTSESEPKTTVGRCIGSVVMGVISLALFGFAGLAMVDVADTYGDAMGGGWGLLWMVVALVASFIGAGAVVMWNPRQPTGRRRAVAWIVGVAIVVFGVVYFLVAP